MPGQVTIVVALIPMVAFTGTGMLIFWRRSNDWAAMLFALTLVTGAGFSMRALWALEQAMPALRLPARLVGTPWTGGAGLVAVLGAGLYAQAYRYRHVSGPVQRQQTKWVALTLGLTFFVLLLGFVIPSLLVDTASAWFA